MRSALKTLVPIVLVLIAAALLYTRFRSKPQPVALPSSGLPVYTYKLVNTYPHDPDAFTQGLVFENGFLYEGTGIEGESTLRKVELETGAVLKMYELPDHLFGEGITIFGDRIVQLTYTSRVGFVYDKATFELLREFSYPTQGWGITHDGTHLIMSDGTSELHLLDPESLEEVSTIRVHAGGIPVEGLNELEYVRGEVFANVRPTQRIARISPSTGDVTGWIDLKWLQSAQDPKGKWGVLNGIAYDGQNDRLFVTGKHWPRIFEIDLIPLRGN
ncbi:MAG: glutaminyl-peptide cyclotransferase [Candidatus Eisenbacteria bacterium]